MTDLADTVVSEFASRFENITAKLHKWVDPLSNQQFWRNPYPYGNSIGHLVLHLTGNLRYYIGAQIAGSGYVRDRDREFTDRGAARRSPGPPCGLASYARRADRTREHGGTNDYTVG